MKIENLTYLQRPHVGGLAGGLAALSVLLAQSIGAQSLDRAVEDQLDYFNDPDLIPEWGPDGDSCVLLSGDDPSVLDEPLRDLCLRGIPDGGPSSSSGGGASTPASMPEGVRQRLDERLEEGPVRGFFMTVGTGTSNRAESEFQDGYQGDVLGLLAGLDRGYGNWVAGFTLESTVLDGDFIGGGDFENSSLALTLFGSRTLGESGSIDFYAGYGQSDNERLRMTNFTHLRDDGSTFRDVDGLPAADFDGKQVLAGAQYSRTFTNQSVSFGPKLALDWNSADFDTYVETDSLDSGLALTFYDDERTSLIATIGLDASFAISTEFGVILLSEYLYWKYELDDEQRLVDVSFVQDSRNQRFQYQTEQPDENYLEFGVNLIFVLPEGLQAFVGYGQMTSHRFLDTSILNLGYRKEF